MEAGLDHQPLIGHLAELGRTEAQFSEQELEDIRLLAEFPRRRRLLESERAFEGAGLLPSLADEFFKLGVRNYVGTAWEVNDIGAELFARVFYTSLLAGAPFGESVRRAR